jgi:hypothetical protein
MEFVKAIDSNHDGRINRTEFFGYLEQIVLPVLEGQQTPGT